MLFSEKGVLLTWERIVNRFVWYNIDKSSFCYSNTNPVSPPLMYLHFNLFPIARQFSETAPISHAQSASGTQYSSLTLRWLSLSMKLPRFLSFFFLPNANLLLPPDVVFVVRLADLRPEVDPPTQKSTVASSRHAVAAHMKPKLYFPRSADLPMERKLRRPRTNAALMEKF